MRSRQKCEAVRLPQTRVSEKNVHFFNGEVFFLLTSPLMGDPNILIRGESLFIFTEFYKRPEFRGSPGRFVESGYRIDGVVQVKHLFNGNVIGGVESIN